MTWKDIWCHFNVAHWFFRSARVRSLGSDTIVLWYFTIRRFQAGRSLGREIMLIVDISKSLGRMIFGESSVSSAKLFVVMISVSFTGILSDTFLSKSQQDNSIEPTQMIQMIYMLIGLAVMTVFPGIREPGTFEERTQRCHRIQDWFHSHHGRTSLVFWLICHFRMHVLSDDFQLSGSIQTLPREYILITCRRCRIYDFTCRLFRLRDDVLSRLSSCKISHEWKQ